MSSGRAISTTVMLESGKNGPGRAVPANGVAAKHHLDDCAVGNGGEPCERFDRHSHASSGLVPVNRS